MQTDTIPPLKKKSLDIVCLTCSY